VGAASGVQAVLLDFGGVVWDMRWDVAASLEAAHALPRGALFATLYRIDAWTALQRGRGERQAWLDAAHAALERLAGRPLPPLHAAWRAGQAPIETTIALARALRGSYRLGILSNNDLTLRERLTNGLGIAELFDDVVCSAEVGCAKPEPEIYALAARRLRVPPGACVFVDDAEANVSAAVAAGMRGVLYRVDRGDDLRAALAAAGVRPPA
jgi:putative hydrolase of the HAD superfamily